MDEPAGTWEVHQAINQLEVKAWNPDSPPCWRYLEPLVEGLAELEIFAESSEDDFGLDVAA